MPAAAPALSPVATESLQNLGRTVKARRKALRIAAIVAAEAAGISRVTLHRIENGEASVTIGAYMAACAALGLQIVARRADEMPPGPAPARRGWIPSRVRIADYPILQQLAWQVHGASELTPREALGIYERNWRHVDAAAMTQDERDLVDGLRQALGGEPDV
jgi:transcriptional regulator with XRE-family HTH domain